MGTVFRESIPRPIPAGAVDRDRKARWRPRGSARPIAAQVRRLADGREVVDVQTGAYYARHRDAAGRVVTESTGCKDEGNARQHLAKCERRVELIRAGVLSPAQARAADRSREAVAEHAAAFVSLIRGKRGGPPSPVHVANVRRYLDKLAADCGWRALTDLTRESLA